MELIGGIPTIIYIGFYISCFGCGVAGSIVIFRMLEWPCIEVCPFLKQTKVKIVRSKPLRSTSMGLNQQRTLRYPQNQIEP
jgi:hypothetical protein